MIYPPHHRCVTSYILRSYTHTYIIRVICSGIGILKWHNAVLKQSGLGVWCFIYVFGICDSARINLAYYLNLPSINGSVLPRRLRTGPTSHGHTTGFFAYSCLYNSLRLHWSSKYSYSNFSPEKAHVFKKVWELDDFGPIFGISPIKKTTCLHDWN
jgi:hypothetical protein